MTERPRGAKEFQRLLERHAWPPPVSPSPPWSRDYGLLVAEYPDAPATLDGAIDYLEQLIARLDAAT